MSTLTAQKFASTLVDSYHSQQARALNGAISYDEATSIFHAIMRSAVASLDGSRDVAIDDYLLRLSAHLHSCALCGKVVR